MYSNCQCPSKDIATNFAITAQLRYICSGARLPGDVSRLILYADVHVFIYRCGQALCDLYQLPQFQHFINCIPTKEAMESKAIYQPGCLRKVCMNCDTYSNSSLLVAIY